MFFLSFGIQIGIEAGIDIRLWNDVLVSLSQHNSKQIFNHISNVTYAGTYTTGQTYKDINLSSCEGGQRISNV